MADLKKGAFEEEVKTHRIRMTLSSRNVEALEKGAWIQSKLYL